MLPRRWAPRARVCATLRLRLRAEDQPVGGALLLCCSTYDDVLQVAVANEGVAAREARLARTVTPASVTRMLATRCDPRPTASPMVFRRRTRALVG